MALFIFYFLLISLFSSFQEGKSNKKGICCTYFRSVFRHCQKLYSYNANISSHLQVFVLWGLAGISGGSRGRARGARASPLFWVKKGEMTEGKKASRARKSRPPPPPFTSRSGSATGNESLRYFVLSQHQNKS